MLIEHCTRHPLRRKVKIFYYVGIHKRKRQRLSLHKIENKLIYLILHCYSSISSALVSQALFGRDTSGSVTKCWLFSWANLIQVSLHSATSLNINYK